MSIPFIDLAAQQRRIRPALDAAIARVLDHGAYLFGPEVVAFERQMDEVAGVGRTLSCANGTDALVLPLMAWDVGPGDAVFCPSFTFAATAEIVPWTGASPVFVDILPATYNMDPASLEAAIAAVNADGKLTPTVVIAVDLFGQPADYPAIRAICDRHGLKLISDCAQGWGCTLNGKSPLHWADAMTTSFFPAKPLGAYGDGGAVSVRDDRLYDLIDSIRVHGRAVKSDIEGHAFDHDPKYMNLRIGMNSRLDSIQAAILIEKLKLFAEEIVLRNQIADRYAAGLGQRVLQVPTVIDGGVSTWAQYVIEHNDRDGLATHLKTQGVPTAVYYPLPIHRQPPYAAYPAPGGLPVTNAKAQTVIALPMHPYLAPGVQDRIIEAIVGYNG
ncbi:MAG TPA: DegT/DnrJ/EryC1/StrS aminotransferase family protein [Caulobacteraceae bacterium]|nr:DegT/DnrJ/EryC1/StrS aminotransferase family protein [Caulobacteraceae bacterium]